jgi:hypothetical protein
MIHPTPRRGQNTSAEWLSAIFTLLVLTGIYNSMDAFSSFGETGIARPSAPEISTPLSVAPPYWNQKLGYGFRSVAWDRYTSSGSENWDIVIVSSWETTDTKNSVKVSFYKDTPIDQIQLSLDTDTPRAYSRLSHGIAVIEGNIDSPSAKTIFSTLHSD